MPRPATRQWPGAPGVGACWVMVGAQRAHGGGGAEDVLAFEEAFDAGLADGEGCEHEGAVADALVAGDGDGAGEGGGWRLGGEGVGGHGGLRLVFGALSMRGQCLTGGRGGGMGRALYYRVLHPRGPDGQA